MATIKFFLQSEKNPANIYVRLSLSRSKNIKRKSGYIIDPDKWSLETGLPKQNDADLKILRANLNKLAHTIEVSLNQAIEQKEDITGDWLQEVIDKIHGVKKDSDPDSLTNWIQHYIDNVPNKSFPRGKVGVVKNTIQKYTTLKGKIESFQTYKKKQYYVKDVGIKFGNELTNYFRVVEKLSRNTTGRYVKYLKAICNDAKAHGHEVNKSLDKIEGMSEKVTPVYLTFDELDKIERLTLSGSPGLENAKDWLILGCYLGQRVSDLLSLSSDNIHIRNGLKLIELTQKKTGARVSIPFHPKVKEILEKRNDGFPDKISDQKFNKHIKKICKLAGINTPTKGSKMTDTEQEGLYRKETGIFPKWELVTTHICRRSFASNFYGEMPTALIKSITGHATEAQFLFYIGKTDNDFAQQIADYWTKEQLKANEKVPMTVLKKAE